MALGERVAADFGEDQVDQGEGNHEQPDARGGQLGRELTDVVPRVRVQVLRVVQNDRVAENLLVREGPACGDRVEYWSEFQGLECEQGHLVVVHGRLLVGVGHGQLFHDVETGERAGCDGEEHWDNRPKHESNVDDDQNI